MSLWTLSSAFFSSVAISRPRNVGNGQRVWRRTKLNKKDELSQYKLERVPFLEERVRKIKETGKLLTMDVDNRFDFINEVAAEANEYMRTIGMSMEALRKQSFM